MYSSVNHFSHHDRKKISFQNEERKVIPKEESMKTVEQKQSIVIFSISSCKKFGPKQEAASTNA
tara:strand:- start:193 stop:384 length:192 start_codon:yes stop_codon:yes gene_type:complete